MQKGWETLCKAIQLTIAYEMPSPALGESGMCICFHMQQLKGKNVLG